LQPLIDLDIKVDTIGIGIDTATTANLQFVADETGGIMIEVDETKG
jgi:hypothetical protein